MVGSGSSSWLTGTTWFPKAIPADIHRMTALLRLSLPLLADFGNTNSSTQGWQALKPVISARRVLEMLISLSFRSPLRWFLIERKIIERFTSTRLPVTAAAPEPAAGYR